MLYDGCEGYTQNVGLDAAIASSKCSYFGNTLPWGFTVWCFFGLIMHHVLFEGAQKQQTSFDLN
jgi:hypothetical protein